MLGAMHRRTLWLQGLVENLLCAATIRVSVADRGPGVSIEQAQRLFEAYYRAPATAGSGKDGVGLGLSIVKSIVEAHGGAVGVESRRGGGARFWFSIPSVGRTVSTK